MISEEQYSPPLSFRLVFSVVIFTDADLNCIGKRNIGHEVMSSIIPIARNPTHQAPMKRGSFRLKLESTRKAKY